MKKGFTLVELSIVLVIIGLLIGGILVGQSLIESSKLKNFVSKIQQYDIAVQTFKSKFKHLPGDSPLFAAAGNGDGAILDGAGNITAFSGELANFWVHLQQSGMISPKYTLVNTATGGGAVGCPWTGATTYQFPKVFDSDSGGAYFSKASCLYAYSSGGKNYWYVAGTGFISGTMRSFPMNNIYALDVKLDDGVALSGIIRPRSGNEETLGAITTAGGGPYWEQYGVGNALDKTSNYGARMRIDMLALSGQ